MTEFVEQASSTTLGLVYGRRRQGKTILLRALTSAYGGFYWQALEQSSPQNLASLSAAWSSFVSASTPIRFADWPEAFTAILGATRTTPFPAVIDEVGYLINVAPELPSVLQAALDPTDRVERTARLVLCGSAFGQMRSLVAPEAPLRGRAGVILVVRPFSYREAADFWGLTGNLDAAFCLHALVGGTPAYRALAGATPARGDIRAWAIRRLLDPRSALFKEGQIVINEDAILTDRQLYWSVLAALAAGNDRRQDIAAVLKRPPTSLSHPLDVLVEAGWIERVPDPLRQKRGYYQLNEPIVRFWRLVTDARSARLEAGGTTQAARVWDEVGSVVAARIYAPHLQRIASEWLLNADPKLFGGIINTIGPTEVRLKDGTAQVDLVGTSITPSGKSEVLVVGEVKATHQRVGPAELARLDQIAEALQPAAKHLLVSRSGFTSPLRQAAALRNDVILADLATLYQK